MTYGVEGRCIPIDASRWGASTFVGTSIPGPDPDHQAQQLLWRRSVQLSRLAGDASEVVQRQRQRGELQSFFVAIGNLALLTRVSHLASQVKAELAFNCETRVLTEEKDIIADEERLSLLPPFLADFLRPGLAEEKIVNVKFIEAPPLSENPLHERMILVRAGNRQVALDVYDDPSLPLRFKIAIELISLGDGIFATKSANPKNPQGVYLDTLPKTQKGEVAEAAKELKNASLDELTATGRKVVKFVQPGFLKG